MANDRINTEHGTDQPENLPKISADLPPDEVGEREGKPSDERNSDQGKMQPSFDAQQHEGGTREGRTPGHSTQDGL
jgi:hypothetical protein